ncbi:hypothetical protein [Paenibacillus terreus]|uniref:hypothetical protein n=1 Tax=Paenibacillus terreus TaxID=1387834 RepID=UPI0035CD0A57
MAASCPLRATLLRSHQAATQEEKHHDSARAPPSCFVGEESKKGMVARLKPALNWGRGSLPATARRAAYLGTCRRGSAYRGA